MDLVEARLISLIENFWRIPTPERLALRRAVLGARYSRAVEFRQHLTLMDAQYPTVAGWREGDAEHLFARLLTPQFVLRMLDDLVLECRLSPRQSRLIEEHVLQTVGPDGQWKPV